MNKQHALLIATLAGALICLAVATQNTPSRTVRTVKHAVADTPLHHERPALTKTTTPRPAEVAKRPPHALERKPVATRQEAERDFTDAVDSVALVIESVLDGDPQPSEHERRVLRDRAVGAYVALARHLPNDERKARYQQMSKQLRTVNNLYNH